MQNEKKRRPMEQKDLLVFLILFLRDSPESTTSPHWPRPSLPSQRGCQPCPAPQQGSLQLPTAIPRGLLHSPGPTEALQDPRVKQQSRRAACCGLQNASDPCNGAFVSYLLVKPCRLGRRTEACAAAAFLQVVREVLWKPFCCSARTDTPAT